MHDDRKSPARAYVRFRSEQRIGASTSYSPLEVMKLYQIPPGDGAGKIIGIVELGGGFVQSDLDAYFASLGLATPNISAVSVAGGKNAPTGNPNSADVEVMLDIEIAGAIAPKSEIRVYFAKNTDAGFLAAIQVAVRECDYVSISWGGPESGWPASDLDAFDAAFAGGKALTFVAAGDSGSKDGTGQQTVDFPASSPHVVACGGTHLEGDPATGVIKVETVWHDGSQGGATGGGISAHFPLPEFQQGLSAAEHDGHGGIKTVPLTMRAACDVAGVADPYTGWLVRCDGREFPVGGTSCVAPMYAGIAARMGWTVDTIDFTPAQFRDIVPVTGYRPGNGRYVTAAGWDVPTGWGSPNGAAF